MVLQAPIVGRMTWSPRFCTPRTDASHSRIDTGFGQLSVPRQVWPVASKPSRSTLPQRLQVRSIARIGAAGFRRCSGAPAVAQRGIAAVQLDPQRVHLVESRPRPRQGPPLSTPASCPYGVGGGGQFNPAAGAGLVSHADSAGGLRFHLPRAGTWPSAAIGRCHGCRSLQTR